MSIGRVVKVGDIKKMIQNLPDDYDFHLVARQRISVQDSLDFGTAVPFHFANVDLDLNDINKQEKFIEFECEIPSAFYFQDN